MSEKSISNLFLDTTPVDRDKASQAIKEFYRFSKEKDPEIVFVDGPNHLANEITPDLEPHCFFDCKDIAQFTSKYGITKSDRLWSGVAKMCAPPRITRKKRRFLGSDECFLPSSHEYRAHNDHLEGYKWFKLAGNLWESCYATVNFKGKSFVYERPVSIKSNDRGFHSSDGPAVVFKDGSEFFYHEGQMIKAEHFANPMKMSLKDIHSYYHKYLIIDMIGVEYYKGLVDAWKPPCTKGRFAKFFAFSKMVVPGDEDIKDSWKKKGRGYHYVDKPYVVKIRKGSVNGVNGIMMDDGCRDGYGNIYHFPKDPFQCENYECLFDEEDKELWDLFNYAGIANGGAHGLDISYQDGIFRLRNKRYEGFSHDMCRHAIAPAWFKAKMFRGEDAYYETDRHAVKYEGGELKVAKCDDFPRIQDNIMSGECQVPSYMFSIDLKSDSWEGLLDEWAKLSFEWLGLHG